MTYAYLRVSTQEQDLQNQRFGITKWAELHGITIDATVEEKVSSRQKSRKVFAMVEGAKKGDTVIVSEMSRLARSLSELVGIMRTLMSKEVRVVFVKEGIDLHENNPAGKLQIHMLAAIAEFERDMISLRTKEALDAKRAEGVTLGRPSGAKAANYKIDVHADDIILKLDNGISKSHLCKLYRFSRPTLDAALLRWSSEGNSKLEASKEAILAKLEMGVSKTTLAQQYSVARSTLYAVLDSWGIML